MGQSDNVVSPLSSVRPRPRGYDPEDEEDEEEEDQEGDILQTVPVDFQRRYSYPEDDQVPYRKHHARHFHTVQNDDRPITPMRDTMVYDLKYSSLDFKDGNC